MTTSFLGGGERDSLVEDVGFGVSFPIVSVCEARNSSEKPKPSEDARRNR